jgi:hypothetical protein
MALTMVFAGCASETEEAKTDEEMIRDTMNGFFNAVNDGDITEGSGYFAFDRQLSQQDEAALARVVEAWCNSARGGKIRLKSVDNVKVTGSMATASIVITLGVLEAPPQEFEFKKQDDAWKITSTKPCSSL